MTQPIEPVAWRRWDKRAYEWETYHGGKPTFPTEALCTVEAATAALEAAKQEGRREGLEEAASVCDVTPPYPFRASIEAAHAIRALIEKDGQQ